MVAIRTENLCKNYHSGGSDNTAAVRMLNLHVQEGEIFGFLGPNGAGKTTTIHLLLGLIRPTSGMAYIFDRPVTETEVHRRLGYLPETVTLHDYYSGRGLLHFYAGLCGVPKQSRAARACELLRLLKLEDAAEKSVAKYSKGMAQRLGFAQAMLHDPDLLILDEPTASLDPVGRREFRDIILELKRRNKTIFISSHILSELESVCDRVAILQNGLLKRVGTLQELSAARGVRLVIKALSPGLMEALAPMAAEVTLLQGQTTIRCRDEATRQAVEELLRQHQVEVIQRELEAQSLEEIFFSTILPEPKP